jgi:hypothetical protein
VDCTAQHHALVDDLLRRPAEIAVGVLLHFRDDQLLVEGAAVHPDAHRFAFVDRDPADGRELFVAPPPGADVARVDPVLVEGRGAGRVPCEQEVAVVVEIADQRRRHPGVEHALPDLRDRRRSLGQIHGHPDHLRAGLGELDALLCRRRRIRGVGHRHRLHDHRRTAADLDGADSDADRPMNLENCH